MKKLQLKMEEQINNNPLSDIEISEILGESSSQAGIYANVVDTPCEVVEPLAIPESIDNDWEKYHPIASDTIMEDVAAMLDNQPQPELDDTQLMKELSNAQTLRFKGASWYDNMKNAEIIVAGVGGIGSWVTLLLSRMTPSSIILFDDDSVELANMAGQCYMEDSIGSSKVTAIQDLCEKMSRYKSIIGFNEKYTQESATADIMICGFDNMVARKDFFRSWIRHLNTKSESEKKKCIFIDGRLLMEEFQILAMAGDDVENQSLYKEKFLFSDAEMVAPLCSQKQTSHMAAMIASMMVGILTNFMAPCKEWEIPRKVPFLTEFDMPSMLFKTHM